NSVENRTFGPTTASTRDAQSAGPRTHSSIGLRGRRGQYRDEQLNVVRPGLRVEERERLSSAAEQSRGRTPVDGRGAHSALEDGRPRRRLLDDYRAPHERRGDWARPDHDALLDRRR